MPGAIIARRSLLDPNHTNIPQETTQQPSTQPKTSSTRPTTRSPNDPNSDELEGFSKVLYLDQHPLTDNYVPSSFLRARLFNHNLQFQSFLKLFSLTTPILNKITTISIWIALIYSIISSTTKMYENNRRESRSLMTNYGNDHLHLNSFHEKNSHNIKNPYSHNNIPSTSTQSLNTTALQALSSFDPSNDAKINSKDADNFFLNSNQDFPLDHTRALMLYNSPLYRLMSNVKPVFSCPHNVTTLPILNIDLAPNPLGHFLCEVQDAALNRVTLNTLFHISIGLFGFYCALVAISNTVLRRKRRGNNTNENGDDNKSNPTEPNSKQQQQDSTEPLDPTSPRQLFKTFTRVSWTMVSILFLTTPILISLASHFTEMSSLWVSIAALLIFTILSNDYSNLFDSIHLVYPREAILDLNDSNLALMEKNLNPSGYIHIHTHMTHEEILDRFNNPENALRMGIEKKSDQEKKSSDQKRVGINESTLSESKTQGSLSSSSSSPSSSSPQGSKSVSSLGFLPLPKTFATIFSLNIIIAILAACGIHQYFNLLSQGSGLSEGLPTGQFHSVVGQPLSSHDSLFIFVGFSALFLSLPEMLYYYIAVMHHTCDSERLTTTTTSSSSSSTTQTKSHQPNLDLKNRKNLMGLVATGKTRFTLPQKIYYLLSSLLFIISILLLTCHSAIQPFALVLLLTMIGIISPLVLLVIRLIPNSKRVIRGPWDYDDYDEVGKDNI